MIFADNEGIAVVPKSIENELLELIRSDICEEKRIIELISTGVSIPEMLKRIKSF